MKRTLYVAQREFAATVTTKGFVFGILVTPMLIGLLMLLMPRYLTKAPPKIEGQVVIIDPTGAVAGGLSAYLTPERFAERREKTKRDIEDATPDLLRRQAAASPGGEAAIKQSIDTALGDVPRLHLLPLPGTANVETEKAPLKVPVPKQGSGPVPRLAVIVVEPDAVRPAEGSQKFGSYALFVRGKLDDRLVDDLHAGMRDAIVAARLQESGLDPARIRNLTSVPRPGSLTVTAEGERTTNRELNMLLPAAFMILLLMSVLTSGQYLLTTTVEEKSSRVVEVLLSAVSSRELMTGKILGQMAVGLLVLALYAGLGLVALVSFATLGLLDPVLIVFLLIFYVLAFFTFASLTAAVGAAVNEMREAQSLQMPIMLVLMIPWILWLPLSREPNSMLAIVLSFVPPLGNFVMLLRMASQSPPPMWQVWLSIAVGAGGAYAALWFAAKVFRVGLLMYGKPPTFGTLVRWARMS
ncbi:MAG TPA: ABC transporter permease [Vicinamibacterales bacterium]